MQQLRMRPEIPYVCGFAFDPKLDCVLLLKKARGPSFNVGRWNGIGGKIENGESPRGAMAREFQEECGIITKGEDWYCYHTEKHLARAEQDRDPRIHFLTTVLGPDQFLSYESTTDEMVQAHCVRDVFSYKSHSHYVYNLRYLVDMARSWNENPQHRWIEG